MWLSRLSAGLQTKGSQVRFPDQGTCLGCGPGPWYEVCERQPHVDVSLSLSPSLPLCLKRNKIIKKIYMMPNNPFNWIFHFSTNLSLVHVTLVSHFILATYVLSEFLYLSFPVLIFHPPGWFSSYLVQLEHHLNTLVFVSAVKSSPWIWGQRRVDGSTLGGTSLHAVCADAVTL